MSRIPRRHLIGNPSIRPLFQYGLSPSAHDNEVVETKLQRTCNIHGVMFITHDRENEFSDDGSDCDAHEANAERFLLCFEARVFNIRIRLSFEKSDLHR